MKNNILLDYCLKQADNVSRIDVYIFHVFN